MSEQEEIPESVKEQLPKEVQEQLNEQKEKNGDSDEPLIDPEVKEELEENKPEDPFLTEYATPGNSSGDSEKVDVTSEWIEGSDWRGKTKLSAEQIIAMTQVRLLPEVFDELEALNPHLESVVENLERYAVSHQGWSREQHVDVLSSMHSGESLEGSDGRNMLLEAFAAEGASEEE